jgi:hypothetical protein
MKVNLIRGHELGEDILRAWQRIRMKVTFSRAGHSAVTSLGSGLGCGRLTLIYPVLILTPNFTKLSLRYGPTLKSPSLKQRVGSLPSFLFNANADASADQWEGSYPIAMVSFANRQRQRERFIALEAMHDVRDIQWPPDLPGQRFRRRMIGDLRGLAHGIGINPTSYLRRAVRPDEIFFVTSVEDGLALAHRAAEESIPAGATSGPETGSVRYQ